MASRAVGEVLNGSMEVLSVGQSLDKRSGQTMLKTRVRFTSGPFKGIETLVKHPVSDNKKGSKSTASKPASNSKNTASKSTSKGAAKSTGKAAKSTSKAAGKSTGGKAKQVKPADTTPASQDTEEDLEELDLDFEDEEE